MALPDRALQVLDLLVQNGLGERPILFICHSLGGLLVKQLLRQSRDSTEPRLQRIACETRAVLFLATPHTGARLASLASAFRGVFGATVSLEDLREHDAHLRDLYNWYRGHAPELGIETVTYFELRAVRGVLPIVNPTSAHPGVGADPVGLDEDHFSISKPRERDAHVCGAARHLLQSYILAAPSLRTTNDARLGTSGAPLSSLLRSSHQQLAASISEGNQQILSRLENLGPDPHVVGRHSELVELELDTLRQRRAWDWPRAREQARQLCERIENGDLRSAAKPSRAEALFWAARLHSSEPEHLETAKALLAQLRALDSSIETRTIDASILKSLGDIDGAVRLLRDVGDPDARAVLFSILHDQKGPAAALEWLSDHPGREDPSFLTGFGYHSVALALARTDSWEEAAVCLAKTEEHRKGCLDLLFVQGAVNAALLLPADLRRHALDLNLFHPEVHTSEGQAADRYREKATLCFQHAEQLLAGQWPERVPGAHRWLLWLRLTHPSRAVSQAAEAEVQAAMQDPEEALSLLNVARAFQIPFDAESLSSFLERRARHGGLEDHELQARFMLAEMRLAPRDFIALLDEDEARFLTVFPASFLSSMRIEALVRDGQTAAARTLLEKRGKDFEGRDQQRLEAMIESNEGSDPRSRLETLYENGGFIDLQNLVRHLYRVKDWVALRPRLEELFRQERTRENALHLVACMERDPNSGQGDILAFLDANQDLVEQEPELNSSRAWALFRLGRLSEARALNDRLLTQRGDASTLQLDINLALQAGQWERFPGIVEREWDKRQELDPQTLIRLASLAADADPSANRSLELMKLAVAKASGDPHILTAALGLAYRLGREGEEVADWLSRAVALSSEDGPVRTMDFRTVADEWLPALRQRQLLINERLLRGAIPLHYAAAELNLPLSYLLLYLPRANASELDSRRRPVIPIISGLRQPVEIPSSSTVGLDVTSLMVLFFLDLLQATLESFERIILAPDTMLLLLNERNRARFHQPSLIKRAQDILGLQGQGKLHVAESLPAPPAPLVEEVGATLAQLLEAAHQEGGRVVHPRPIHRLSSRLTQQAELGDYDDTILSAIALEQILWQNGFLDSATHERASRFLSLQDRDIAGEWKGGLPQAPLYLDSLAVGYLQSAGLLPILANCPLDLRIHPSLRQEQLTLIAQNRECDQLAEALDNLRVILRDGLLSGRIAFSPRYQAKDADGAIEEFAPTLSQLLTEAGPCDAICVDDRFVNKNPYFTDRRGKRIQVLCVLDLLRSLEATGKLATGSRYASLDRLRRSGFSLAPLESGELLDLLKLLKIDQDGAFTETAELRILRQTIARIRSLDMLHQDGEGAWLVQLQEAASVTIRQLWAEETSSIARAAALADWVWRHISPSPIDWIDDSGLDAFASYLTPLFLPLPFKDTERREAYLSWVQARILDPLSSANPAVLDRLALLARRQIEEWSDKLAAELAKEPSS